MTTRPPGYYENLYKTMTVLPDWEPRVGQAVRLIGINVSRYAGFTIPWQYVGILHYLEAGCRFERQILNGQPWDQRTTIEPIGLGPWETWGASTIAALARREVRGLRDLEAWNGMGYARRGVNSPYLWSGSNHGVGAGKYVADGKYDPAAVSNQVGAAALLHALSGGDLDILALGGP
jgi:lysozyme family protein